MHEVHGGAYWRGGYSDEACRASIRYAFERIGVERVVALILPANPPSLRLALRCGLRFERDIVKDSCPMRLYAVARDEFFFAGSTAVREVLSVCRP